MATGHLGAVTYVQFPNYTKVKVPHFRADGWVAFALSGMAHTTKVNATRYWYSHSRLVALSLS
jgi:hypothetical protein